jgi:hypothetical protein
MVLTQPHLSRADWQAEVEKMRNAYKAPSGRTGNCGLSRQPEKRQLILNFAADAALPFGKPANLERQGSGLSSDRAGG